MNIEMQHFGPEDGGGTVLRNAGIQPPYYTAQQLRKLWILNEYIIWAGKSQASGPRGDLGVRGKILQLTLDEQVVKMLTGLNWPRDGILWSRW